MVQAIWQLELELVGDFTDSVSQHLHACGVGITGDDQELVPAESDHRVGVARAGLEDLGKSQQSSVANVVVPSVVDQLEVIQIEKQQAKRTPALGMLTALHVDHASVAKPSERIRQCLELGALECF